MDKTEASRHYKLNDRTTCDITLYLRNKEDKPEKLYSHSTILVNKSKFFANTLSEPNSNSSIEMHCTDFNYHHHVKFLKLLYLPEESVLESLDSVNSTLAVLEIAVAFECEDITRSCVQYLEAVPWEDKEEEAILKSVLKLGQIAMPILSRIQHVSLNATKKVFISAVRFATSVTGPDPPFGDELKTSAQEQIDYMLGEDEETPLITNDEEVKLEVKKGLSKICSSFENELYSMLLEPDPTSDTVEKRILQRFSDLEWMCNIVLKIDMMKDFVSQWVELSSKILKIVEDIKLENFMWGLKVKLVEITLKVLEAVGYGNVILAAPNRVKLLKTWLPYIQKLKPCLDLKCEEEPSFTYKMDEDLCQGIEGAIMSLVLALPANDQADIFADWMSAAEQVKYPDLSEAFEVWCYRTKSAKRRLEEGLDKVGNNNIVSL